MPIVVISGTAGTGKTALAVRFGRQVAKRFPDGQLYVNLRGLDPATPPMEPAEALRFFLDALGVPPYRIPADTEGRSALFRSMLDGKRMLIVLDNARNVAQVRPLLPGSPGSLVVVTSRNELTGLVAAEGAVPLTLDVLSYAEAREMLVRRLGQDRAAAEPEAADEIIFSCARLPLALGIAVGRAAGRPKRPLTELAAELRDARGRLDALEAGDAVTNVRAVLSWSYDQLSEPAARMFRLLGVHPGPDISLSAAASLAGLARADAGAALRELSRTHMVAEYLPARFTFHDLLRAYAADQAERHDPAPERRAAVHRVLDHYLHTAMAASHRFSPFRSPLQLAAPQPGVLPADVADKEQAMAWFDAEVPVLLALIAFADTGGFDTHAWQIPWTLGPFFNRRGRWQDYIATQQTALAAAGRLADTLALAHAHHLLGHVQSQVGDYEAADPNFRRALDEFRELGDRPNEAVVLNGLAGMLEKQERYPEALAVALDALRMLKAVGHWWTQATLENGVGWLYAHLGQYDRALTHCQRALSPAPRFRPPRRHRRHPGQPGLRPPAPGRHRRGQVPLHQGHRGLPRDRLAVRRGQLAGRARRRPAGRGRPRCRRDGLARGRRHPGPAPAPARRRGPDQAPWPAGSQPRARGAGSCRPRRPRRYRPPDRGSHRGSLGIKETGYGDETCSTAGLDLGGTRSNSTKGA